MLNLSMIKGLSGVFFLSVFEADGVTPQDLTGGTLNFRAQYAGFVIAKSSPTSGITIVNPAGGPNCATLIIEPADTADFSGIGSGSAAMPCQLTLQLGSEDYPLNTGTLTISANVGTP